MIKFVELYTMSIEDRADLLWALELCYQEQMKRGEELDEIFEKAGAIKGVNSGYDRAEKLARIIHLLGGVKHDNLKEEYVVCD